MKREKIILCLLLSAALVLALAAPAAAAGDADTVPESPEEAEPLSVLDEAELDALIADYMAERDIREDRFAMAFCYTGTGETYYYNPDEYINAASLYKLPLMMGLARKVSAGELQQTDQIYGMDISYIETRAITYSDNNVGEAMIGYFGPFRAYRLMQAEIAGIPEEELPEMYFSSNAFSVRLVMGVLRELWSNTETYPNIIECMKAANPGEYFRLSMDGQYEVAQKYGGGDGYLHTAGIIYTPTPILLVVMTYRVTNAEYAIANLAQLLADYSLTLDERRDALLAERAAEAERLAAEKAEQERLAAEQAEQERRAAQEAEAERQRLEAENAARQQAEAAATPIPAPGPAVRGDAGVLAVVLVVLGAAAAVLIAAALLTRRKQKIRR